MPLPRWESSSLRKTLFEILESCNEGYRSTYANVARLSIAAAHRHGLKQIVELGAGTAPIARRIAADAAAADLTVKVCDLVPNAAAFDELEQAFPDRVRAVRTPVNYGEVQDWKQPTLAILLGTFGCIPASQQERVLSALVRSTAHGIVFEPLRCAPLSLLLITTAVVPGLLLPLFRLGRPGTIRRLFWCWVIPLAPILFVCDGLRYAWNCPSEKEWRRLMEPLLNEKQLLRIEVGIHSQTVSW